MEFFDVFEISKKKLMKLLKNCSNVLHDLKNVKIVEKSLKIGPF
jgi:hypothetical protein